MKFVRFLFLSAVAAVCSSAMAIDVNATVSGTPATVTQGQQITFDITFTPSGNLPAESSASLSVSKAYTLGSAPSNPAIKTWTWTPTFNPTGRPTAGPTQEGAQTIGATLDVPIGTAPGTYTVTIDAFATTPRIDLGTMPSFTFEVLPAGTAPIVTILAPANGTRILVGSTVTVSADVHSTTALSSAPRAWMDANEPGGAAMTFDSFSNTWNTTATFNAVGTHTVSVKAGNAFGSTTATNTVHVHYNFGAWLPPITTAQMQSGRTLPVKFTVLSANGPTAAAVPSVYMDDVFVGQAVVMYDNGIPYYQLNVKVGAKGAHVIRVDLDDSDENGANATSSSKTITAK